MRRMKVDTDDPLYHSDFANSRASADLPSFVAKRVIGSLGESLDAGLHDGPDIDASDHEESVKTMAGCIEQDAEIGNVDRAGSTLPNGGSGGV